MGEHMHPEVSMHTHPVGEYMIHIHTIHQAFDLVTADSPLPWLHIAEAVAEDAQSRGFTHLGITGTRYLMSGPVYSKVLEKYHISCGIPEREDRERIDKIIFEELVDGIFLEDSRLYFNRVIQGLKEHGCNAVVLGCTEIPLLVDPSDCPLPTLDSTRLLARAALREALREG
jgi:aspartate racemase